MGTWGELDGSETCGELWGGLNWFRLRLGRENFSKRIYLTNPIQCTYAILQLLHRFNHCGGPIRSPKSHGLSALFRRTLNPRRVGPPPVQPKPLRRSNVVSQQQSPHRAKFDFKSPCFAKKHWKSPRTKLTLKEINPMKTIVIWCYLCIINHSYWCYWSYVHQLSYLLGAPHFMINSR